MSAVISLTPSQRQAVEIDNDALVLAGAGSGKTRVLVERIIDLIQRKGVKAENILAITFTNKAAKEMTERLVHTLGEEEVGKLSIGTFHSICYKWLRRYGKVIGIGPKITIYDEDYQFKAFKYATGNFNKVTAAESLRRISRLKNKGFTPEGYLQHLDTNGAQQGERELQLEYAKYQDEMKRRQAVDFDDLLLYVKVMLERVPEARMYLQNAYQHILVDEHQDTNDLQYQIIHLLKHAGNQMFFVG